VSNHLAIATVSAALGRLIQGGLDADVPGATVSHERPGGPGDDARRGVTVFLFQVTPNAALRNADLPARDAGGRLVQRPTAALDLHYLLTCFGDAASFEPERIMGSLARRLHEQAVLDPPLIAAAVEEAQNLPHLAGSDLGDAPERVRFAPTPLNLEELSKLWSILFQTSYRLSAAYRASVVQLEARADAAPGLPVRRRGGFVLPLAQAEILAVKAADGPTRPITWGSSILLTGRGLDRGTLLVNGVAATPASITRERIELDLLPASFGGAVLNAGVATVRLRLPPPPGAPAHLARETAAFPFLLRPVAVPGALAAGPADPDGRHDGTLTVTLDPPLATGQAVRLLLDRVLPRPPVAAVLAPVIPAAAVFPLADVAFAFTELPAGTYLLRAQLDGAESAMVVATNPADPAFGTITGPQVIVP
jgi:hypothetical protein